MHCDDTGSLSKTLEGDLDCARCDVAGERVNFEAWTSYARLLGGGVVDAWKLYQMGKAEALEKLVNKTILLKDKMPPEGALAESDREWFAYQVGRMEAFEDSANLLDRVNNYDNPMTASDCADAIRSLKDR